MGLADEIADFVRDYLESPTTLLTPETETVATIGSRDPDNFSDFPEDVVKRFSIGHRPFRDMTPGVASPHSPIDFVQGLYFRGIDIEIVCVDHLTTGELSQIAEAGTWHENFITPTSECCRRG